MHSATRYWLTIAVTAAAVAVLLSGPRGSLAQAAEEEPSPPDASATEGPTPTPLNHGIRVLPEGPVIPPGQDELLGKMLGLGVVLPGECKFAGGNAKGEVLLATYDCGGATVELELAHPSRAQAPVAQTEKFAIRVVTGTPPAGMTAELAARITAHERDFLWLMPEPDALIDEVAVPYAFVATAAVLVLALLVWLRSRKRSVSPP